MTAPNMAAFTASLERSLQNCSLNQHNHDHHRERSGVVGGEDVGRSSSSDDTPENNHHLLNSDTTLELNSHLSLPYHWEQCLDLKTGEIYYINWRNGMKATEDPRTIPECSGEYYYSEDDSSYDSEESSSESSLSSSREQYSSSRTTTSTIQKDNNKENVLVVAGCKSCLMYFMVPKQVEDCPKCNGQLLHFDRSSPQNGASFP